MWLSQHVLKDPTGADDDQWSEETREECEGGKGHKGRTTAQTTHNGGEIISIGAPLLLWDCMKSLIKFVNLR